MSRNKFNKNDVKEMYLQVVEEFNLLPDSFLLTADSALLFLGLRESTDDLDVMVDASNINRLKVQGFEFDRKDLEESNPIKIKDNIDILYVEDAFHYEVDGIYIEHPFKILELKEVLKDLSHRPKEKRVQDLKDIDNLKKWIKDNKVSPYSM